MGVGTSCCYHTIMNYYSRIEQDRAEKENGLRTALGKAILCALKDSFRLFTILCASASLSATGRSAVRNPPTSTLATLKIAYEYSHYFAPQRLCGKQNCMYACYSVFSIPPTTLSIASENVSADTSLISIQ